MAVAGIHGRLGQLGLVGAVDQRKFFQFFPVGPRQAGIGGQLVGGDAGTFQFLDGLGGFLAKSGAAALAVVVDDFVQQAVRRTAHQQGTAGFAQGLHGRTAVTAQQCFRQRGEGVAFHVGGQAVAQNMVERPLGGGGELFRHDEQAALAVFGAGAQLGQHPPGFPAAGGA